jgi:thioredoxin 1
MASDKVSAITTADFEAEVLQSTRPVLVDFWAEWCGPCRMLAPLLDEIAQEQSGKVKIVKVNVDHESSLAAKFGIQSIPTLILFKDGEKRDQITGLTSKKVLVEKLAALAA